jgi:hypothetical protein
MWEDPIVAEVRRVRAELMSECNGDIHELFRRAIAVQNEDEDRLDEGLKRAIDEGMRSGKASREEVFAIFNGDAENE